MTSLFYSPDANPLGHLTDHYLEVGAALFNGVWAMVELQPDLFSPQKFVIGVAVGESDGGFVFRLVSDARKFECVYGKSKLGYIKTLLDSAEHSLIRAMNARIQLNQVEFECSNLSLSSPWVTSGASDEHVMARLFAEVVAMEPSEDKDSKEFFSLDTGQVRRLVAAELKRIGGMRYEQVAVEPKEVVLVDEQSGETHALDLTLRKSSGAGSVLSAVYKTPSTIELNLLRASRDLSVYGRMRKADDLALFIMSARPEHFEPIEYGRVSDLLDEQSWRLERQGFRVEVYDDPSSIARSIYEWADIAV